MHSTCRASRLLARGLSAFTLLSAVAGLAHAAPLYSNGPVVGANGKSVVYPGNTVLGYGFTTGGLAVADDFTVAAGSTWKVDSLGFYAYSTGATTFTFTSATWSIVSGDVNTGTVVASGVTDVTNGGAVGYRVSTAGSADTQRQIYLASADVGDFELGSGSYWLRWSMAGSGTSVWQPTTSDGALGNAAQASANNAFATLADDSSGRSVALPFLISGSLVEPSDVPEPGSLALLVAGLGAGAILRRRKRV